MSKGHYRSLLPKQTQYRRWCMCSHSSISLIPDPIWSCASEWRGWNTFFGSVRMAQCACCAQALMPKIDRRASLTACSLLATMSLHIAAKFIYYISKKRDTNNNNLLNQWGYTCKFEMLLACPRYCSIFGRGGGLSHLLMALILAPWLQYFISWYTNILFALYYIFLLIVSAW